MATIVAAPTNRDQVWNGDFYQPYFSPWVPSGTNTWDNTQYNFLIAQTTSRFQILSDTPPPGLAYYARLTVDDADLSANPNPRCQLQSPYDAAAGNAYRFSWWTRLTYKPSFSSGYWLFTEIFGSPFYNSPQMAFYVSSSGNVQFQTNQYPSTYATLWQTPLIVNRWMYFSVTAYMSTSATAGWVQFAFANDGTSNAVAQNLTLGSTTNTTLPMQTLNKSSSVNGTTAGLYPDLYRSRGLESVSTVDHAGPRIDAYA